VPTLGALVVLEQLEAFEGCPAGNQLVREFALVVRVGVVVPAGLVVDLLVGVLGFVCSSRVSGGPAIATAAVDAGQRTYPNRT
jgi:hypothetical protein